MFVSELFTGTISDQAITEQSGFYETLQTLKQYGCILDVDAVMVDKGFNTFGSLDRKSRKKYNQGKTCQIYCIYKFMQTSVLTY